MASDLGLRDDDVAKSGLFAGAFNVLWYGLFVAVLLYLGMDRHPKSNRVNSIEIHLKLANI